MQVRVQRAAAALAQRKANARAAAEQSEQAGLGGKGGRCRSKHQPSSAFKSMSRDQVSMGHALLACLPCRIELHYMLLTGEQLSDSRSFGLWMSP